MKWNGCRHDLLFSCIFSLLHLLRFDVFMSFEDLSMKNHS